MLNKTKSTKKKPRQAVLKKYVTLLLLSQTVKQYLNNPSNIKTQV